MDKPTSPYEPLPRFQQAGYYRSLLLRLSGCSLVLAGLIVGALWLQYLPRWRDVFSALLAAQLLFLAVLQAAFWSTHWRRHALALERAAGPGAPASSIVLAKPLTTSPVQQNLARQLLFARILVPLASVTALASVLVSTVRRRITGTVVAVLAASAIIVAAYVCNPPLDLASTGVGAPSGSSYGVVAPGPAAIGAPVAQYLFAIALLVLAFVLLVIERFFAAHRAVELPEAPHITYQLRVALSVVLLLSFYVLFAAPIPAEGETNRLELLPKVVALLVGAIALEILLRLSLTAFNPPTVEPKFSVQSFIAALWQWPMRPLMQFQDEINLNP